MPISIHTLHVATRGKGLYEITDAVARWVTERRGAQGLLTIFVQHTSASLIVQENADPDVVHDLKAFFDRLVVEDGALYRHGMEGEDDMPAHIRAALTLTQLCVPVRDGRMMLGTWQGIYLFEHRRAAHSRSIVLHLMSE